MSLRLDDQICFPLYAAARAMQQRYRPLLHEIGLTYPQYLVMLVLWERDDRTVSELGQALHLDSGTLTPLLKRLESNGIVSRTRSEKDNRIVRIRLTPSGSQLKERAESVPGALRSCIGGSDTDLAATRKVLDQLLTLLQDAS